jgi:hypothetical protein
MNLEGKWYRGGRVIITLIIMMSLLLPASVAFAEDAAPTVESNQETQAPNSISEEPGATPVPPLENDSTPIPPMDTDGAIPFEGPVETTPEAELVDEPTAQPNTEANPEQGSDQLTGDGTTVAEIVEYIAENDMEVVDSDGNPLPLGSTALEQALAYPDPWIERGGTTYRFLATGGCESFGGISSTCSESATPVQDAINFAAAGETINIEGGNYNESITVSVSNLNLLGYSGMAYLNAITLNANVGTISNVFAPILYVNNGASIQDGIDLVESGGVVYVAPGTYNETASNRRIDGVGPYRFGLFIGYDKQGITIQGVKADSTPVTQYADTAAFITTNATNHFGYSGVFVEGDDVTINGLIFGDNLPSNNKTIEVIGDNFSFSNNRMVAEMGSLYFGDWDFNTATMESQIERYLIANNSFENGSQIAITSGTGNSGAVSGRQIINNVFNGQIDGQTNANYALLSFSGKVPTVGWFKYPVGGAVITGNTFLNSTQYVRARGEYQEAQFDWQSIWCDNTYTNPFAALMDPATFSLRPFTYTSGPYIFENVRRIGSVQANEVLIAEPGDIILTPDLCAALGICSEPNEDPGDGGGDDPGKFLPIPFRIIPVTGGLVSLSCDIANLLELPDGRQLVFADVLCEYLAGFEDAPLDQIKEEIKVDFPEGLTYQSGITFSLVKGETTFLDLPAEVGTALRFPLKRDQIKNDFSVLRWDPFLNNGLGDWEVMDGEFLEKVTEEDYYLTLPLYKTGTYLLTIR